VDVPVRALTRTVSEASLLVLASAAAGLAVNAAADDGLPLVARRPYAILVPCPEPVGDARPVEASDPKIRAKDTLAIDARSREEFESWHLRGAMHLEFDWLGPPPDKEVALVAKKMAASRTRNIVVYGDGGDPDSGREWARLLSGARIKNVHYVVGGAAALNPALERAAP
jgi:rhodanese-related sulfurtransferase